jgi:hypothetical protein
MHQKKDKPEVTSVLNKGRRACFPAAHNGCMQEQSAPRASVAAAHDMRHSLPPLRQPRCPSRNITMQSRTTACRTPRQAPQGPHPAPPRPPA